MNRKKWIVILILLSSLFAILFLLFFILYVTKTTIPPESEDLRESGFELDQNRILVHFDPKPFSFPIEIRLEMESLSDGAIISSRIKDQGWSLEIDPRRRLVLKSEDDKVESIEIEPTNRRTIYGVKVWKNESGGFHISLLRNHSEIAKGMVKVFRNMGIACWETICQPSFFLRGKVYEMRISDSSIFSFDSRKKKIFSDIKGDTFICRESSDFIFDTERE